MNQNEIIITYGTDFKQMAIDLCESSNLMSHINDPMKKIGIKPNLVGAYPAEDGATTHPEIVAGVIEYLQSNGCMDIHIIEGSWIGDKTSLAYEICGYVDLANRYHVNLIDTQKDHAVKIEKESMSLNICESVEKIDFLINVPVLKGHCQTKMTCALKNMKGLIPNSEKRRYHTMGLHKPIAYLNKIIRQDFIIVDGICGDLNFEDGGNPVVMNRMYTCLDPVLCDSFGCSLIGKNIDDVKYIKLAESLGIGTTDLSKMHLIELSEQKQDIQIPDSNRVLKLFEKAEEVDSCSACYGYLIPTLDRLDQEGLLVKLKDKVCIGQGYRGQKGKLGIGSCTKDFQYHLDGCPPVEEDMYLFLKNYILTENS